MLDNPKSVYYGGSIGFLADPDFLVLDITETITSQLAIGLQKDSEFKKLFDYQITKQIQSGLISFLINKWVKAGRLDEIGRISKDPTEAAKSLSYANLLLPFIILSVGIAVGGAIFCTENVKKRIEVDIKKNQDEENKKLSPLVTRKKNFMYYF